VIALLPAPCRENGARLTVRKGAKRQPSAPPTSTFERLSTATRRDILMLIPDKTKGNRGLTGLLPIYEIFGLNLYRLLDLASAGYDGVMA
jgi:hypothetical protein